MKKYVCTVCGYVHTGDSAPDQCPVCKVGADKFVEQTGEMKLAAEHEYGIYAKTVKNNADISAEESTTKNFQLLTFNSLRIPSGRP